MIKWILQTLSLNKCTKWHHSLFDFCYCMALATFSNTNIQIFTDLIEFITFQTIKSRWGRSRSLQILGPWLFLITPVPCDHSLTPASVQWVGNNPLHCLKDINFTFLNYMITNNHSTRGGGGGKVKTLLHTVNEIRNFFINCALKIHK